MVHVKPVLINETYPILNRWYILLRRFIYLVRGKKLRYYFDCIIFPSNYIIFNKAVALIKKNDNGDIVDFAEALIIGIEARKEYLWDSRNIQTYYMLDDGLYNINVMFSYLPELFDIYIDKLINHKNKYIEEAALKIASLICNKKYISIIIEKLSDNDVRIRHIAAQVLFNYGDEYSINRIIKWVETENKYEPNLLFHKRYSHLSNINIATLNKISVNASNVVKNIIIEILSTIGHEKNNFSESISLLDTFAKDKNRDIKNYAKNVLEKTKLKGWV